MYDFSGIYSEAAIILHNIVFGEKFEKSFPYAIVLVGVAFLISLHRRGYRLDLFRPKLNSMAATTLIYFINLVAFGPIFFMAGKAVQLAYDGLNLPHLSPDIWQGMPVWSLVLLTLVVHDFADYWNHRLMHKSWLWPVHAIHHSETDMTGLTAYRVHFLEPFIMGISYVIFLSWLGMPKNVFGYGAIVFALHNVYVHMDMDWGHGPFRLLLASPRYHRWHHADVPEAHGKNLANFFPVYDWIFGTYYVPGKCSERLGAEGVPVNDVAKLMLYPFREWGQMLLAHVLKPEPEDDIQDEFKVGYEDQLPHLQDRPAP